MLWQPERSRKQTTFLAHATARDWSRWLISRWGRCGKRGGCTLPTNISMVLSSSRILFPAPSVPATLRLGLGTLTPCGISEGGTGRQEMIALACLTATRQPGRCVSDIEKEGRRAGLADTGLLFSDQNHHAASWTASIRRHWVFGKSRRRRRTAKRERSGVCRWDDQTFYEELVPE